MSEAIYGMRGRNNSRRWSAAKRAAFLDMLAMTCNVRAAAAAAAGGVFVQTAYRWRRRDMDFAAAWSEALALGYETLEMALVGHALVAVELAIRLLTRHRDAPGKPKRFSGSKRVYADQDDSDRAILAKLAVIEARRAKMAKA